MKRAVFGLLLGLSACSRTDPAPAPVATAAGAAVAPPPATTAVNAAGVQRYTDEVGPTQISATIQASVAEVRTGADRTGDVVAGLARGAAVTEIVQRGVSVLVLFADPTDATRTLEGWVLAGAIAGQIPIAHRTASTATSTAAPEPVPTPAKGVVAPAATAPPAPPHGLPIKIMPIAGKCSAGYVMIQSKYCRLSCRANTDCAATAGATCRSAECYGADET